MSYDGLYYPTYTPGLSSQPRLQTIHPFRNLLASGSHRSQKWYGAGGHPDYGFETSDYDYHSGPPAHIPSGGSYSYHSTAGTGYGPPPAPVVHPPPKLTAHSPDNGKKGIFGGGGGKRGSSAMSALTLLSFLFFVNLLQSCIKDHMDAMNPTVMVMTTNIIRNRFNKMGEMNSREHQTSNSAHIAMQPADLIQVAAPQSPVTNFQSTYSQNPISYNKPQGQTIPQSPSQYTPNIPEPEVHINYAKPQYDPYTPDPYDSHSSSQHTLSSYNNHTLAAQPPPSKLPTLEHHYNFHHTEYNAQPLPQSSIVVPQYGSSHHYSHQQPMTAKPYNNDYTAQYSHSGSHQGYDIRQNHFPQSSSFNDSPHPWSSNAAASSVLSRPLRRASVIAVTPKTRWITVPAKIIDSIHLDMRDEGIEEQMQHHDDRNAFHSRFN